MFTIKNLLKISLGLILVVFTACKTRIEEEAKESLGFYAYSIGDSIKMYIIMSNKIDTINLVVTEKDLNFRGQMEGLGSIEFGSIKLTNNNKKIIVSLQLEAQTCYCLDVSNDTTTFFSIETYNKIKEFYQQKGIDGILYDSVFYIADSYNNRYIYTSRSYGFIKFWNDTVTIKFER